MMLTLITSHGRFPLLHTLWRGSRALTLTGVLMLPVLAIALAGLLVDPRVITGAPAWLKPAKFAASISIYAFTLAWIFSLLPEWRRTRRLVGPLTAAVLILEMGIIALQAFRGVGSHFNVATPLDAALFAAMGAAIVTQTLSTVAVAIAVARQRLADPALGVALRFGMVITIVGALSGGLMTRPTGEQLAQARAGRGMPVAGAHTVGAPDGGPGLPVTGWSTEGGDLRVAHFVGLHALQVLPLLALLLKRRQVPDRRRLHLVRTAGLSYAALFGILLLQALRGEPAVAPGALTVALLVVWGAGSVAAAALGRSADRPAPTPLAV